MKNIAITGGKGGTGKSTFSIILANHFLGQEKKIFLVDLDVECPNDYILLNQDLKNPKGYTWAKFPKLDQRKCKKCGICAKACPENAIFQAKGQYPIFNLDLCSGCGLCHIKCPYNAIKFKKEKTGEIFVNQINNNLFLITGKSKPGLEETGPVVRQVKEFVMDLAQKQKPDLILFDTAAGTHCPVINALLNTDLAYIVTEPTPMGAYDFKLILSLCKKLKLPVKVVLNQSDLGDNSKLKNILTKENLKINISLPYSLKLAKAYSRGELLNIKDII